MNSTTARYTKTAKILHWLIAIVIFGMFALGWYMSDLPKEAPKQMAYDLFDWGIYTWHLSEEASPRTFYFNLHKSIGVTLLGLIFIRIVWRFTHKPPAILSSYQAWERKLANLESTAENFKPEEAVDSLNREDSRSSGAHNDIMTDAQASYLRALCEEVREEFNPRLTKSEAAQWIDELQAKSGRDRED